jgi:hypothetical protein
MIRKAGSAQETKVVRPFRDLPGEGTSLKMGLQEEQVNEVCLL